MKKYNRQNVYDALFEIYELTQKPTELAISKIFRQHNLSGTIGTILVKNGIVKVVKSKRPKMYLWNSVKPHYKMVDNVIEKTQELSKFYKENPKKQKLDVAKQNDKTIDDNIGYWSKFENANYMYSLAEEDTKVEAEEVDQPIDEEKDWKTLNPFEFEICDFGTKENLKQLQEESENSIHKIGELHEIIENYKNMVRNLNNERQHNIDKILDQNRRIEELSNYKNETLYSTKELKNEVEKWHTAYNEMQYKLERQVKIANDLHQQTVVLNKKQKDRAIKNFTLLWGMIKINY